MNPSEVEKIRKLVNVSLILSPQERSEWLALLGIMNDKQLLELEKILVGGEAVNKSPVRPPAPVMPQTQTAKLAPVSSALPKLSHIVNIPTLNAQGLDGKPAVATQQLAKAPSSVAPTDTPFLQKLKSMFAEKELPVGKASSELELESGKKPFIPPAVPRAPGFAVVQPAIKPIPAVVLPTLPKTIPQIPPVSIVAPTLAPVQEATSPHKPLFTEVSEPSAITEKSPKAPAVEDLIAGLKAPTLSMEDLNSLSSSRPKKSIGEFTPGLSIKGRSQQDRDETLARIKERVQEGPEVAFSMPKQSTGETPKKTGYTGTQEAALQQLEDLPKLSAKDLRSYKLEGLIKNVKNLMKKFGYYDAIFNIEKSQLYKDYLSTGIKLLDAQMTFEQLADAPRNEAYLEREEFEKFTDLLIHIQAA